jgi:hypothetical protein
MPYPPKNPLKLCYKNRKEQHHTYLFHPVILKEMLKRFILIITGKSAAGTFTS